MFPGFDTSVFYSRIVSRQLCRENEGIVPIDHDNIISDESSGDEEDLDDPEFGILDMSNIDLGRLSKYLVHAYYERILL